MLPFLLAGVIYHFSTIFTNAHGVARSSGRLYAEGSSYRLELDPTTTARDFDVAISRDGDVTAVLLNNARRKYHDRVRVSSKTRSSILFQFPFPGGEPVGRPIVLHREEATEMVAGHPAKKHVITVEYRLRAEDDDGTPINALVHAVQTIWCAEDLPRLPFERELMTGWMVVDRELKPVTSSLTGMTLGSELVVTRTFEGGPPIMETTRTTIDDLRVEPVSASMFAVPADFVYDRAPMAPRRQ